MPYSQILAGRIRDLVMRNRDITEKKMFGGVVFLLHGNLLVGVWHDSLIARLGPDEGPAALEEPHVRPFDVTGKPMKNWCLVEPEGIEEDRQLKNWLRRAQQFVETLPPK